MVVLLDTNVCINFARGRSLRLLERLEAQPEGSLAMSAVTYAELSVGTRSGNAPEDIEKLGWLTRLIAVKPFDRAAGDRYGQLVRLTGIRRHSFDLLIAAHALSLGAALITSNVHDFVDIPGLLVENWTTP